MMKKNKLYIANRWNQPAFMVDRQRHNIFDGLTLGQSSQMNSNPFGVSLSAPTVSAPKIDWGNPVQRNMALGQTKALTNSFGSSNPVNLQQSNQMLSDSISGKTSGGLFKNPGNAAIGDLSGMGANIIGSLGPVVGGLANNLISDGLSSGAGSAVSSIGGTVGSAISSVNPVLGGIVSAGSGILGGTINALFGQSVDEEALKAANEGTAAYNNFTSNAGSFDDITGPEAQANVRDVYKDGLFGGDADEKNEALRQERRDARSRAFRSVDNNINNLVNDQINDALANYSAFGGPLDYYSNDNMSAVNYGFMSDYLTMKKRQAEQKNKMSNLFAGMPSRLFDDGGYMTEQEAEKAAADSFHNNVIWNSNLPFGLKGYSTLGKETFNNMLGNIQQSATAYAFGGDLQTNGGDYPTGLVHIGAGLSHEENPYEGVQLGKDSEGTPNLVEENETVWNDYVFSNRIPIDQTTKEMFHIGKKREMTYADLSKKLEKEIAETPNDPISKAGFEKQMQMLEEQQERQKQEMEAERAKAAFEALSPEEQTALMQQKAEQEAIAQQAAMQEAAAQQQPTPEEIDMVQQQIQQMQQADGSNAVLGQEPQMNCFGGKLFADGGDTKKNIFRALGKATDNDFIKWLEENGLTQLSEGYNDIDWNNILTDDAFISALTKDDAALADAIKKGYSFGVKTPTKDGIVFTDPDRGNWDRQMFEGWNGSKDDAWIELVKAHGVDKLKRMKREDLEKAFKETNAYKNTTKWLQSSPENMRRYLKSVLDTSSSKSAKKHALQFVNEDGTWKDASKIPTYAQVFGENGKGVRETYPGTYWHSVREANIGNRARNLVWNPENEGWDEVVGDVGKDWVLDSSYDFYNEEDNLNDRVNYYYRSEGQDDFKPVTAEEAKEAEAAEKMKNFKPKYRKGLFGVDTLGPLAALTMQGLGIGRGDTSVFDAAASGAGNFTTASWMPRGDFMKLKLTDPWRYTMPMLANSRATDRALVNNSGGNRGTAMAGLLANGYNTTIGLGEAALKGDDVNWQRYVTQKTHDAGVHEGNQKEYGVTSRFNAGAYNDAARASANAKMQAAAQRFSADRDWYGSLYGNVGNFFGSLTNHKKENDTHNMIADMAANGIFGVITPDSPMGQRYLQWVNSSAEGGKIKKKRRGLTF